MNPTLLRLLHLVFVSCAFGAESAPAPALKGLDPVALSEGREVAGKEELSVNHGEFRFLFSTPANLRRFEADADRFGVQMGGACARMGPLSGAGNPSRWHVHDGRIYLFASDTCRTTFVKAPEDFIDQADAPPEGSDAARARGQSLLERAVAAHGGAANIDGARTHRIEQSILYRRGSEAQHGERSLTFALTGRLRQEETWTSTYGHVITPERGFLFSGNRSKEMDGQTQAFARRELLRHPIALLQARKSPGFVAVAEDAAKSDDAPREWLRVHFQGATSRLGLDPASGRIVELQYRGHGERIGDIAKKYADFRSVNGVLFAFSVDASFNGRRIQSPEVQITKVTVNEAVTETLFSKP